MIAFLFRDVRSKNENNLYFAHRLRFGAYAGELCCRHILSVNWIWTVKTKIVEECEIHFYLILHFTTWWKWRAPSKNIRKLKRTSNVFLWQNQRYLYRIYPWINDYSIIRILGSITVVLVLSWPYTLSHTHSVNIQHIDANATHAGSPHKTTYICRVICMCTGTLTIINNAFWLFRSAHVILVLCQGWNLAYKWIDNGQ